MNFLSAIQDVASVLNAVVLAVGYYFLVKLYREWVGQWKEERSAGGRPQVVLTSDYSHLPEVYLVVRNFTKAPAKDVTFEFSAPVEDSSGLVISDLPFFKNRMPFLEPEGQLTCRWDSLPSLVRLFKGRGLKGGIKVTTKYKDLAGEVYESEWTLDPLLFDGAPIEISPGMNDLVEAVQQITRNKAARNGRQLPTGSEENRSRPG